MDCFGDCYEPPPDKIASMPPPPLPSYLLPRSAIVALSGNDSQPCFAAFMCDPTPHAKEQSGIELIELSKNGQSINDDWVFVLISSCVGICVLGALLAIILMKCKQSFNVFFHDPSVKQPPPLVDANINTAKRHSFMASTVLYPSIPNLQNQMGGPDNGILATWATLTPRGTRHFVTYPTKDDHYEIIDFAGKNEQYKQLNATPIKNSFENNGFVDYYDYEMSDPYDDDFDSGYQEPLKMHEHHGRTLPTSAPPRIDPPPSNHGYPMTLNKNNGSAKHKAGKNTLPKTYHH